MYSWLHCGFEMPSAQELIDGVERKLFVRTCRHCGESVYSNQSQGTQDFHTSAECAPFWVFRLAP